MVKWVRVDCSRVEAVEWCVIVEKRGLQCGERVGCGRVQGLEWYFVVEKVDL